MPSITQPMSIDFLPSSTAFELFAIGARTGARAFPGALRDLSASQLVQTPEGCTVVGDLETLYRLNLHSRLSTRVLLRVGKLRALHFPELRRKVAQLPWPQFAKSAVGCGCRRRPIAVVRFTPALIIERVELGVADSKLRPPTIPDAPLLHVFVRGQADRSRCPSTHRASFCTVGATVKKMAVHRCERRWPRAFGAGEFSDATALCDPMWIRNAAIEAALVALRRAPGLQRSFAFSIGRVFSVAVAEAARGKPGRRTTDATAANLGQRSRSKSHRDRPPQC